MTEVVALRMYNKTMIKKQKLLLKNKLKACIMFLIIYDNKLVLLKNKTYAERKVV